jgi:Protein of unknown function (DUF1592)/Protein of unknown function (DUF1588)/Protein of unknown function (DUF1587)/Protein of unknown function (DUF1585)/Protein of unknown function (DUF1595)
VRRNAFLAFTFGLAAATSVGTGLMAADAPAAAASTDASKVPGDKHWAMLNTYCEKCHNSTDWTGGIAFDTMQPDGIAQDAKVWETAVSKLRGRMMPPPGEKQPDQASIDSFVSWMEGTLDRAAAEHPDAGYVSLHRLNRVEYARAVKDLLNVEVDPTELLPQDTKSDGFDNVASVLKVSPTFLDQYISAARTVAALAVGSAHPSQAIVTYRAGPHDQAFHVEGLPLGTRGGMSIVHNFPADGTYTFNLSVGSGLGYIGDLGQEHKVVFLIDGKQVFERIIGGPQDLKDADQKQQEATKEFAARFRGIKLPITAGPHQLVVTFVQRAQSESDDWLASFNPMGAMGGLPRIGGMEINGPMDVTGLSETPSRARIFSCRPTQPGEEAPCARQILSSLMRDAYRRPVTDADLAAPLHFFEVGRQGKDFDAGIQNAIVAILASPKFLYRVEVDPQVTTAAQGSADPTQATNIKASNVQRGSAPAAYHISDLELASRLSFFLWSQGPDPELLNTATSNKLHEPAVLDAQVKRMLANPRANALVTNFAFQWLQVDSMDKIQADPNVFPYFDEDLRIAFRKEMELFVGSILLKDRPVTDLLTANWSYLNERLALHYGIRDVRGSEFRRVELTDSHRFGLLGKGAILMGTSYANRTAPVLRGAYVLEVITGTPPHAPPPAIPALKENVPGAKPLTIRERMEMHRSQPSCNACHGIMDPIGMSLENFDAMGKWQNKDAETGTMIDTAGKMADGQLVNGPDDLRKALAAHPDQFNQTLTINLMTYALGRSVEYFDMPVVRRIVRDADHNGDRFSAIVMGIVGSPEFQMQQPRGDAKPADKTASNAPERQSRPAT